MFSNHQGPCSFRLLFLFGTIMSPHAPAAAAASTAHRFYTSFPTPTNLLPHPFRQYVLQQLLTHFPRQARILHPVVREP